MRFHYPTKLLMNTLMNLVKKLYKNKLFEFAKKENLRFFYVHSENFETIISLSLESNAIDFFTGKYGFFSFYNLINGDGKALTTYNLDNLTIEPLNDLFPHEDVLLYLSKYHFYTEDDKKIFYKRKSFTENERVINYKEALFLITALQYLNSIVKIYETDNIECTEKEREYIVFFEFDDKKCTYACNYVALDSIDFLPFLKKRFRRDEYIVNYYKNKVVMPGTLYLGSFVNYLDNEEIKYINGITSFLKPIVLYAANDNGVFDYVIFSTFDKYYERDLKKNIYSLIEKIGLCDTIITDNFFIYRILYKSMKCVGIEVLYNNYDKFNTFMAKTLDDLIFYETIKDLFILSLEELKKNFKELYKHYNQSNSLNSIYPLEDSYESLNTDSFTDDSLITDPDSDPFTLDLNDTSFQELIEILKDDDEEDDSEEAILIKEATDSKKVC